MKRAHTDDPNTVILDSDGESESLDDDDIAALEEFIKGVCDTIPDLELPAPAVSSAADVQVCPCLSCATRTEPCSRMSSNYGWPVNHVFHPRCRCRVCLLLR